MTESQVLSGELRQLKEAIRGHPELAESKRLKQLATDDDFETEDAKETVNSNETLITLIILDVESHG